MRFFGKNGSNLGSHSTLKADATAQNPDKKLTYNINIPELFARHFGYQVQTASEVVMENVFNGYKNIEVLSKGTPNAYSKMGVPVWDYIKIEPTVIAGTGKTFNGYDFPLECVVTAHRKKHMVETAIVGKDGEVEELMALKNIELTIKGFIINYDEDAYPEAAVEALQEVCELKDTNLPVESTFLNLLNIRAISIHELKLDPMAGYEGVQTFEIIARSKTPFELTSSNGIQL